MKLIIHDLDSDYFDSNFILEDKDKVIPAIGTKAPCIGCFGCWIKTPGKCVLKDRIKDMGASLASCSELTIISKSIYGGFDSETKNIVDRSISYILPFFRNINKEQHHKPRYVQRFKLNVIIYNLSEITEDEKELLEKYIKAMSINFNSQSLEIKYCNSVKEITL